MTRAKTPLPARLRGLAVGSRTLASDPPRQTMNEPGHEGARQQHSTSAQGTP